MPYNPGVSDQRAMITMQGLQMGQQNALAMGQWLSNFLEKEKQASAGAKSVDYMIQADPTVLHDAGMTQEQYDNMGARDKIALGQGVMHSRSMKQAALENQARIQEQQQRAQYYDIMSQAAMMNRETQRDEAGGLSRFAQLMSGQDVNTGAPPPMPDVMARGLRQLQVGPEFEGQATSAGTGTTVPGLNVDLPPAVRAAVQAVAGMGTINPREGAVAMRHLMPTLLGEVAGKPQFFQKGAGAEPIPNLPGYYRVPLGYNQSQVIYGGEEVGKPVELHNKKGNLIGFTMTDAHRNTKLHLFNDSSEFQQAMDEQGNPVRGYYVFGGKPVDARTIFGKKFGPDELGDTGPAAAPAAAPAALAKNYDTADEVKKAVEENRLSRADALQILREKFFNKKK